MRMRTPLFISTCCLSLIVCASVVSADDPAGAPPMLGQVRTLAVNPQDQVQLRALAHEGWLEASGQVLHTQAFYPLYQTIGRTWTASRVPADEFALPDLDDQTMASARRARNPYGVLGPGDLVSGGERLPAARPSLLHFIYVGKDASEIVPDSH